MADQMQPLEGLRVLDLSRALAGPFCAMMLGDLGADVIKVENPRGGDETRGWGPPYIGGESAYYLSTNRNKRSVTVNLKDRRGVDVLERLAAASDILIENFGPGAADRLGIGWDVLHGVNSRLIYCRISSFRPDSRYESVPGYDFVIQAMSGLMSITGNQDGEPQKVGVAVVDVLAGLFACSSILSALHQRDISGEGRLVEVSLLDSALASLVNVASSFLVTGTRPRRWGNAHANLVPYQVFSASDGGIAIGVGNDPQFERLCSALGRSEWAADPRFRTNSERVENRETLVPLLGAVLKTQAADYWVKLLGRVRVPAAPVNYIDEIFRDPYIDEAGMLTAVEHPTAGELRLVSSPLIFGGSRPSVRRPPPLHGEHTIEVLQSVAGLSEPRLAELRRAGVV